MQRGTWVILVSHALLLWLDFKRCFVSDCTTRDLDGSLPVTTSFIHTKLATRSALLCWHGACLHFLLTPFGNKSNSVRSF